MTVFPALMPSSRSLTPGGYPHTVFAGMSGQSNRVRNSNVMLSSQLRLSFTAITESQMLSILSHYQERQGTFLSFPLPSAIWNGVISVNDYQLAGYGWRYIKPPNVTDAMCANAYDVELTLETVPPEGTAAAGLDFLVRTTLAAGTATGQFNFDVAVSLAAGSATAGAVVNGFDKTVTWTLSEAVETDPSFSNVSLLLHMDGSNGSTTFTDSGPSGLTVTANGNAQISTAQSKFGGASGYFDGNGDFLSLSATAEVLKLGTGNFTIEAWIRTIGYSTNANETYWPIFIRGGIYNTGAGNVQAYDFRYSPQAGNRLILIHRPSSAGFVESTHVYTKRSNVVNLAHNTWYHVAAVRAGNSLSIYLDGVDVTDTSTGNYNWSTLNFSIDVTACSVGRVEGGGIGGIFWFANGYIDDLRITKGIARYTSNFTPPTAPFPDS